MDMHGMKMNSVFLCICILGLGRCVRSEGPEKTYNATPGDTRLFSVSPHSNCKNLQLTKTSHGASNLTATLYLLLEKPTLILQGLSFVINVTGFRINPGGNLFLGLFHFYPMSVYGDGSLPAGCFTTDGGETDQEVYLYVIQGLENYTNWIATESSHYTLQQSAYDHCNMSNQSVHSGSIDHEGEYYFVFYNPTNLTVTLNASMSFTSPEYQPNEEATVDQCTIVEGSCRVPVPQVSSRQTNYSGLILVSAPSNNNWRQQPLGLQLVCLPQSPPAKLPGWAIGLIVAVPASFVILCILFTVGIECACYFYKRRRRIYVPLRDPVIEPRTSVQAKQEGTNYRHNLPPRLVGFSGDQGSTGPSVNTTSRVPVWSPGPSVFGSPPSPSYGAVAVTLDHCVRPTFESLVAPQTHKQKHSSQ